MSSEIVPRTDSSFDVAVAGTSCIIEVWDDNTTVYGPTCGVHTVAVGEHYAAYIIELDGTVRDAGLHLTTVNGVVELVDVVGDEGRAAAREALAVWVNDPDTPARFAAARTQRLNERLAEERDTLQRCRDAVTEAERRLAAAVAAVKSTEQELAELRDEGAH